VLLTVGAAPLVNTLDFPGGGRILSLIDDLYVCNTAGSNFNDFLGDCVVHSLTPVSDAGTNTMTQVNGTTGQHFTNVNQLPPDDDATYLAADTAGQKEMFGLSTIPADVLQVLAVSVNVTARKQAPGLRLYKTAIDVGGTEADSASFAAALAYIQTHYLLEVQPGGAAWTNAALQSAKIGFFLP
jgi:hypothetical protein